MCVCNWNAQQSINLWVYIQCFITKRLHF
uniref:Uncharacterized protein n=1 Tax=Arundo donax TaxID=35708 RepID=A0A0A8YP23_ARUDO